MTVSRPVRRRFFHCFRAGSCIYQRRRTIPGGSVPGASTEAFMHNKLCAACMHTCKQESGTKIVRCPNFRKHLSENEFRDLVNELEDVEARAAELERNVKNLIDRALTGSVPDSAAPGADKATEFPCDESQPPRSIEERPEQPISGENA